MKSWSRLEKSLFVAFLLWSTAGLIFTFLHITADNIARQSSFPSALIGFIRFCLRNGDPILILLAFANTHLHAARQWSASTARRWALIILVCSFSIETIGACTGFPFGSYHYTQRFGPLLGIVPMTIPLAWHVVVTNALFLVRVWMPHLSRLGEGAMVGAICALYDFVLEPFATTVKGYWVWSAGIPLINYVAWFVISGLLVWRFAPTPAIRFRFDRRPAVILGVMVLIFIVGRLAS